MNGVVIRLVLVSVVISSILIFSSQAFAEDCKRGQESYKKGLAYGNAKQWQQAKAALSASVGQCNRFNNWYLLGQVESELDQLDEAATAFEDARRYATNNDEQAIAIARYAEVQSKQGLVTEPLTLLHEARKMHSNSPEWLTALVKKLDNKRVSQPLTIAQVTGALTNKSIRLFNLKAKPALNVNINFEFDSVNVVEQSRSSVDILANALMDKSLDGQKVTIVGHTDFRGTNGYNSTLSKKRADRIAQVLVSKYPALQSRITTQGAGEKKPLYLGKSEWENQMNRRIEIQLDQ